MMNASCGTRSPSSVILNSSHPCWLPALACCTPVPIVPEQLRSPSSSATCTGQVNQGGSEKQCSVNWRLGTLCCSKQNHAEVSQQVQMEKIKKIKK